MTRQQRETLGFGAICAFIVALVGYGVGHWANQSPELDSARAEHARLTQEVAEMETKLEYLPQLNAEILQRHESIAEKQTNLDALESDVLKAQERLASINEQASNIQQMLDSVAEVEQQALTISSADVQNGAHAIYWGGNVNITRTIYPELEMVIYTHPLGQNIVKFSELSEEGRANAQACAEGTTPCLSMTATRFQEGGVDYDWDTQVAIFWYQRNRQPATLIDFRNFDEGPSATLIAKSQELRAQANAE